MGANISAEKPSRDWSEFSVRPLLAVGRRRPSLQRWHIVWSHRLNWSRDVSYLTATSLTWMGGMVLFGMGALLAHNDSDGERPLSRGVDDVRITQ